MEKIIKLIKDIFKNLNKSRYTMFMDYKAQ